MFIALPAEGTNMSGVIMTRPERAAWALFRRSEGLQTVNVWEAKVNRRNGTGSPTGEVLHTFHRNDFDN